MGILPGDDTIQKSKQTGNILDKPKGSNPPTDQKIGFLPQHLVYTSEDCLNLFNKLSAEEKIKFINKFKDMEFKLTPSDILEFKF